MNDEMIRSLVQSFVGNALAELDLRLKYCPIEFAKNEEHEVLGALLARQTTLAIQLAESPSIWTGDVAPIILRAMADVHITVVWILKDARERSRQFIRYGLGQAKLNLEHRKAELDPAHPDPKHQIIVEALESWIDTQRFTWLTEVNLGSWSGKNVREMAEEAGCIDFYKFVYSPFSSCAHSTWEHVERYNLRKCQNPLHRFHRVPAVLEWPLDPNYLRLVAKYLRKTLHAFDEVAGVKGLYPDVLDRLDQEWAKQSKTNQEEADLASTQTPPLPAPPDHLN